MQKDETKKGGQSYIFKEFMHGRLIKFTPKNCLYIAIGLIGGLLFIGYHLSFEQRVRRITTLSNEVKEMRYKSITLSSRYMNETKQSSIIQRVNERNMGLKELVEAPRIIEED